MCFSPYQGGMELDSLKIANLLSETNDIVYICKSGTFLKSISRGRLNTSIEIFPISFNSKLSFRLGYQLRRIIKRHNIKNILFFGASELGAIYIATFGIKINIIIQHGTTKRKKKNSIYHKIIYKKVNHHVAVSEHIASNVARVIPWTKDKINIIHTAIKSTKKISKRPTNKLSLLHVGRIDREKGQIEAIEACGILHANHVDFQMIFIGGVDFQEEFKWFENKIRRAPHSDKIHFLGFKKDLHSYYAEADILLFPSHGEGMSNVVLEALAYGLQCVCYENTSFPELKKYGFHYYTAKNLDLDSLKETLLRAVTEYEQSKGALLRNIDIIKERFSPDVCREKFGQLLR